MKPVYLEFCGINSFSEKAAIDFTRLLSGGIFGIFGKTGSGKSTILDAIHLALYGKIERASGSMSDCINYRLDKAYVEFRFELTHDGARRTYHVRRERRKKAGGVKAWLYRVEGETLCALAEGTDEVDEKLHSIIGLDFSDFKKCIALPQGEFDALVKSGTADRVSLVSRLFDLEKYGERLGAKIRRSYEKAHEECTLLAARMEENAGVGSQTIEETIAQTAKSLADKTAALTEAENSLATAKRLYELRKKQAQDKSEYETLKAKLSKSETELPAYETLLQNLAKADGANAVKTCEQTLLRTRVELSSAQSQLTKTQQNLALYEQRYAQLKEEFIGQDFDTKTEETALNLGKVRSAEADITALKKSEENLNACLKKYREIKDLYPQEDFAAKLKTVDDQIEQTGGEQTFAEFVKKGMKDLLTMETYGEIRKDLTCLQDKYPQIQPDVAPLIKKYTLANTGDPKSFDLAQAKLAFDQIKRETETLKAERKKIEDRQRNYEKNELEKEHIIKEGALYRAQTEDLQKKLADIRGLGGATELSARLESLKQTKKTYEDRIVKAEQILTAERAKKEACETLIRASSARETTDETALNAALSTYGFQTAEEATALLNALGDLQTAKSKADTFFAEYRATQTRLSQFDLTSFADFTETALSEAKTQTDEWEQTRARLLGERAVLKEELTKLDALKKRYAELQDQLTAAAAKRDLWEQLKTLTAKNKFMEFIASEYLQEICDSASKRLLSLTGNRYFLKYEKEFKAGDNFNGGALRAVKTLSGGETFLVSLSLALSLSDAISRKSLRPIEFFFLDEGFGTLDGGLVDTVMDVLGKLSKTFSIGVISHVEELKHRIDNKIVVSGATEQVGSKLQLVAY